MWPFTEASRPLERSLAALVFWHDPRELARLRESGKALAAVIAANPEPVASAIPLKA